MINVLLRKFPWLRRNKVSNQQLIVSWSDKTFSYVLAEKSTEHQHTILRFGVETQGSDTFDTFLSRLGQLHLKDIPTIAMLRPEQYNFLQIDTPAVAPEELKAAARYQIKQMVDVHLDDLTIDVMRVGDESSESNGKKHLFVVAAKKNEIQQLVELCGSLHLPLNIIDIQENALRNIQIKIAELNGNTAMANAKLVLTHTQAMLTISSNSELFYSRRFDIPDGFDIATIQNVIKETPDDNAFQMVEEYVPAHSADESDSYYSTHTRLPELKSSTASDDDTHSQRFLLEVQRSLDVWERSWSTKPLQSMHVYAGDQSIALATWLSGQLGATILPVDPVGLFRGFQGERYVIAQCYPLLGVLLRVEERKL